MMIRWWLMMLIMMKMLIMTIRRWLIMMKMLIMVFRRWLARGATQFKPMHSEYSTPPPHRCHHCFSDDQHLLWLSSSILSCCNYVTLTFLSLSRKFFFFHFLCLFLFSLSTNSATLSFFVCSVHFFLVSFALFKYLSCDFHFLLSKSSKKESFHFRCLFVVVFKSFIGDFWFLFSSFVNFKSPISPQVAHIVAVRFSFSGRIYRDKNKTYFYRPNHPLKTCSSLKDEAKMTTKKGKDKNRLITISKLNG